MSDAVSEIAPMLVPVVFWLVIGAIAITSIYLRHQRQLSKYRLIQTLAEQGQAIPAGLFDEQERANPRRRVEHGILLIGVGTAIALFLWAMTSGMFGEDTGPRWLPFLAAFPLLIGLAYLVVGLTQRPHE
jgi:hypothetical protein